jgi:hypothetical protein
MTATCTDYEPWPRRRWWGVVILIFIAQLGLIFWLSDRTPPSTRVASPAPQIRVAGKDYSELLALDDPTLFALPHREGFSGLAWLSTPSLPAHYFYWSDPPRWMSPEIPQFGAILGRVAETNDSNPAWSFGRPVPELSAGNPAVAPREPGQSVLRLAGGLSGRRILTPVLLLPQSSTELLTNTVVQVVVNRAGSVEFVPTLLVKSGSAEADKEALRIAGTVRFGPVDDAGPVKGAPADPAGGLMWGTLVFEWYTIPMPPTNMTGGP